MCKKVYKNYKIKVTNDEGEKFVKFNNNVDMTSFSVARKYYSMTKDKYSLEDATVELVGVREDGSTGVMYSKTFIQESVEDKELLKPTDEIVDEIKGLLYLLTRKSEYHNNMVGALNKKQDVLLHKIESIKSLKVSKEDLINEKLKIVDELESIRHTRRFNKEEVKKLSVVYSQVDIEDITARFSKIDIPIDTDDHKYITGNAEEKIIKEIKYNSEKQKANILKQIGHKYKKVVDDKARGMLVCYNFGYSR